MGPFTGRILAMDTVSQNTLNTIKIMKFDVTLQILVLGSL